MSSEINNSSSTCNFTSLGNYDGFRTAPNSLGNIMNPFVSYPVQPNFQLVPQFAGTGDYSKPNYNTLTNIGCPFFKKSLKLQQCSSSPHIKIISHGLYIS